MNTRILILATLHLPAIARADEEAERAALRQIKAAYEDAVNHDQVAAFAPHLAADATGVMLTDEEISGAAGLEAYWRKIKTLIGAGGSYHVAVNVDKTDLRGVVAISRGTTNDEVKTAAGKEFRWQSHWTAVLVQDAGAWKVTRLHASMDPLHNPFVNATASVMHWIYAGGGVLAGMLIGVIAARRRKI